mmetsp:Transcript_10815/g.19565  ORF Transcript_10815/g.19565 Transcript_10815/m.19565 type:complete len:234 (-) Transcript_10815:1324-2025(-)
MLSEVLLADALQTVVDGVLVESPVHETPRQVVERLLLVLDNLGADLAHEGVVQVAVEVALDRQRVEKQLFQVCSLGSVAKNERLGAAVDSGPAGLADHSKHVGDAVVDIPLLLSVETLGSHDGNKVRGDVQRPAHVVRRDQNTNNSVPEQPLHPLPVGRIHALVDKANAGLQNLSQSGLLDASQYCLQGLLAAFPKEAVEVLVDAVTSVGHQVDGGQLRLAPARNEDERGLSR